MFKNTSSKIAPGKKLKDKKGNYWLVDSKMTEGIFRIIGYIDTTLTTQISEIHYEKLGYVIVEDSEELKKHKYKNKIKNTNFNSIKPKNIRATKAALKKTKTKIKKDAKVINRLAQEDEIYYNQYYDKYEKDMKLDAETDYIADEYAY